MKIALIGAAGQLGTELAASLPHEVVPFARADLDITDAAAVEAVLSAAKPQAVINAAAYNLVDRAEDEPAVAFAVNALGPRHVAQWCAAAQVRLLHVSTDYVFSGRTALFPGRSKEGERFLPYRESDRPQPLSVYATSKLAGEHFVRALCPRHLVVRTCGLYGRRTGRKGNFVETMLRLGRERGEVAVVDDQRCAPTAAADLAGTIAALLETDAWGLYHATSGGETTWCGFAREIFRLAGMTVTVNPISTADFGARAARPAYSVLSCERLAAAIGRTPPPWQESLAEYLRGREA